MTCPQLSAYSSKQWRWDRCRTATGRGIVGSLAVKVGKTRVGIPRMQKLRPSLWKCRGFKGCLFQEVCVASFCPFSSCSFVVVVYESECVCFFSSSRIRGLWGKIQWLISCLHFGFSSSHFIKWRSARVHQIHSFKPRTSPQWLSELRRLWTIVPWRVACELVSLCFHTMPG